MSLAEQIHAQALLMAGQLTPEQDALLGVLCRVAKGELEARLRHLLAFGLQGMEAFYSGFTPQLRDENLALAEKYGLYVTAGSDYHGSNKKVSLEIGRAHV